MRDARCVCGCDFGRRFKMGGKLGDVGYREGYLMTIRETRRRKWKWK